MQILYPKLFFGRHFQIMACVRDIFDEDPVHEWQGVFSGVFKQLVEWMEWSLMHGIEHFMVYTFDGNDYFVKDRGNRQGSSTNKTQPASLSCSCHIFTP